MVRSLIGLAGAEAHDEVADAVRTSRADHCEPGVGLRLGAGAWMVTARAQRS